MRKAPNPGPALTRLASLFGIATRYRSSEGEVVGISTETIVSLLAVLGVHARSPSAAQAALVEQQKKRRSITLEPVQVHRRPGPPFFDFAPRGALNNAEASLVVELEEGGTEEFPLRTLDGVGAPAGRRRVQLPDRLPFGAHTLHLLGRGFEESATLLVAPATLPAAKRGWGGFAPAYALRGADDLGIGSFGALGELAELLAGHGASLLATLPLYDLCESPSLEVSPYLPCSRLAWNGLYLDLGAAVAESHDTQAQAAFGELRRLAGTLAPEKVAYAEQLAARAPVIARLASVAMRDPSSAAAIGTFYAGRPELASYCRFRADRGAGGNQRPAGEDELLNYHRYLQYAVDGQLRALAAKPAGLLLDLPVGVHPDGFDTVEFASSFAFGATVGAPPDRYQASGQNWAFPPPSPNGQRADSYRYLRASLRAALSYARVLRLDHVMGLERLWWIPEGAEATDGAYVANRTEELHAIVAIEAARVGAAVVGEDLGTVSPTTEQAMDKEEMLHSAVLQFTLRADGPLPEAPARAVASIATHDLPRFATFWRGNELPAADLEGRQRRHSLRARIASELSISAGPSSAADGDDALTDDETTTGALHGLLSHMGGGPADIVLVDLEDCWLEELPINRPGTEGGDNWRRRSRYTLAEVADDPRVDRTLSLLDRSRRTP